MAQRLMNYWVNWQETQSFFDCQGKCLAVKLAAEVADLSEAMRLSLRQDTSGITDRLAVAMRLACKRGGLQSREILKLSRKACINFGWEPAS